MKIQKLGLVFSVLAFATCKSLFASWNSYNGSVQNNNSSDYSISTSHPGVGTGTINTHVVFSVSSGSWHVTSSSWGLNKFTSSTDNWANYSGWPGGYYDQDSQATSESFYQTCYSRLDEDYYYSSFGEQGAYN